MQEASILNRTLEDRATVRRQTAGTGGIRWDTLWTDLPCALSRTAKTNSPDPGNPALQQGEGAFRAAVFFPAGTITRLGDRAEIRRGGQCFSGVLSDSVPYPSHSVAVLLVREVKAR